MNKNYRLIRPAIAFIALTASLLASRSQAAFSELGRAGTFTVLTTNIDTTGAEVGIGSEATTITGDVGLGPYSNGSAIKATVNGDLYVDKNSNTSIHSDLVVNGSTFTNQDLSGAVKDAFKASDAFAKLNPAQTFGDISGAFTFTGHTGLNVSLLAQSTSKTL